MSKAAPKKRISRLGKKCLEHARALEVGKAGYRKADQLLDEIAAEAEAGALIRAGDVTFVLVDQFETKTKVSSGLSVRRYKLEEAKASDVTGKL